MGPLFGPLFRSLALSTPITTVTFSKDFLNTYKDTGFLPKWLAPDERGMMPGTLIDGVFADAVTKGIAPDLHENMLTAMLQTAQKTDPTQHFGRHGNEAYKGPWLPTR